MPKGYPVLACQTCGGVCGDSGACSSRDFKAGHDEWSIFRKGGSIQWLDIPGTIPGQGDEDILKGFLLNYILGRGVVGIVLDYCVRDAMRCFVCQFNFQDVEHSCCMRELSEARDRQKITVASLLNHQAGFDKGSYLLSISARTYVTPRRSCSEVGLKASKKMTDVGQWNAISGTSDILGMPHRMRRDETARLRAMQSRRRDRKVFWIFKRHRVTDRDLKWH
eukprot:gb/GEZN01011959.1/.p1 GENE.gb/GEZN01011959.1/~~gb/GEZN01011959.1/.p1  ORF type:complete len:222 (+),score=12.38 gb/GEZN01011959.1/:129-794(+)